MYLVGRPDPLKVRTQELVRQALHDGETLVTDVEVFQEILHRFASIRRLRSIDEAFNELNQIVTVVFSYDMDDIRVARAILREVPDIQARDAIHAAIMRNRGIDRIMSHDGGFDFVRGIERIF